MIQKDLLKELEETKVKIRKLEKKINLYSNENIICAILDKLNVVDIALVPVELEKHKFYEVEHDNVSGIIEIKRIQ